MCDPAFFRDEYFEAPVSTLEQVAPSRDELARSLRLWAVTPAEFEHRAKDGDGRQALCGTALPKGTEVFGFHDASLENCRACERAAENIRAERRAANAGQADRTPGFAPRRVADPLAAASKSTRKPGRLAASKAKLAEHKNSTPDQHLDEALAARRRAKKVSRTRSDSSEISLYGRKMIVPVRLVRGGAPGLGRRR